MSLLKQIEEVEAHVTVKNFRQLHDLCLGINSAYFEKQLVHVQSEWLDKHVKKAVHVGQLKDYCKLCNLPYAPYYITRLLQQLNYVYSSSNAKRILPPYKAIR
jgi:hypothetical protein